MTIPQILSAVGWPMFGFSLAFLIIHTVNLAIPRVDFLIASSRMPVAGFLIATPLLILGLLIGLAGHFSEQIHERWLEKQRNDR